MNKIQFIIINLNIILIQNHKYIKFLSKSFVYVTFKTYLIIFFIQTSLFNIHNYHI